MKRLLLIGLLISSSSYAVVPDTDVLSSTIKKFTLTQEYKGEQACEVQLMKPQQLNEHISIQVFTLLSCGGGNHFEQYVAVVEDTKRKVYLIGNDTNFTGTNYHTITNDTFSLDGSTLMPGDAHCCPSKQETRVYKITNINNVTRIK